MTTKEQERKALEQIRKIVVGLGENSYVATAFEGCFEDAEENIENDFACSWKNRAESLNEDYNRAMNMVHEVEKENEALKDEIKGNKEDCEHWKKLHEELVAKKNEYHDTAIENWNKFREQEDKVEALEQEIIKLKAKLYDAMVGA